MRNVIYVLIYSIYYNEELHRSYNRYRCHVWEKLLHGVLSFWNFLQILKKFRRKWNPSGTLLWTSKRNISLQIDSSISLLQKVFTSWFVFECFLFVFDYCWTSQKWLNRDNLEIQRYLACKDEVRGMQIEQVLFFSRGEGIISGWRP